MSDDEKPRLRPRAEAIMAKGKAAVMVIGAIATACTAIWGAVRQPPEPGAKIAYEILREALQQEKNQHEKLEEELDELKDQLNACGSCGRQLLLRETQKEKNVSLMNQLSEVQVPMALPSAAPKHEVLKKKPVVPTLPHANELGL